MLKIGDFSRLAHVTVKTLRHYGKVGLLKPAWIDRFTGYRYYFLPQLSRLNRILALKDLGFTLEQIRPMLDSNLPVQELRQILRSKQEELEGRVQAEQVRLAQVESRLKQIDTEGSVPSYEVVLKRLEAQMVASIRDVLPGYDTAPQHWEKSSREIEDYLKEKNIRLEGPWFTLYHDPEYTERNIDVEMAVGIESINPRRLADHERRRVTVRRLPAMETVASVLHTGDFDTISQAYAAVFEWVERNNYKVAGPVREIYLDELNSDGMACRMVEVQAPVEKILDRRPGELANEEMKQNTMEQKLVERPAFMVMGLKYQGKNQHHEISQMWGEFNRRMEEMHYPFQAAAYGVCNWIEGAEEGVFEYVSGVEVKSVDSLPENFVLRMIPAHRYAVFTHRGKLDTLGETYRNIYQVWLPQSGLKIHPDKFDMEIYDEAFKLDADDSVMWIYVAVE